MKAGRVILIAMVFLAGGVVFGRATVKPYSKLTFDERMALQESETRLSIYDQKLNTLEKERRHHKISAEEYAMSNEQLVLVIRQESLYQNALLVHSSDLPLRARDLCETLELAALAVPVGIGYVIAACPQLLSFLTMIH